MTENLAAQLKELIVERLFLDINPEDIEDEVELSEYGVDSFLLLELIVAMEEMFIKSNILTSPEIQNPSSPKWNSSNKAIGTPPRFLTNAEL